MGKKGVAATAAGSGTIGYVIARLAPADLVHLADRFLDVFKEQGPYAFYAVLVTLVVITLLVSFVTIVPRLMQNEINRIAAERDKIQQLFIDEWRSTHKRGKKT